MTSILEANPEILDLAFTDLTQGCRTDTEQDSMTTEQVLRCAILKQLSELTYDDLEYYLADSLSFRAFVQFRMRDQMRSALWVKRP